MGRYTQNQIKLDISNYRHYMKGTPKIGKTRLFRDLVIEAYGDARFGLLLSIGDEVGYKTLDNLFAFDHPTWLDFVATVDDLCDNKAENEFKILAIDTVDELVKIVERRVLDLHFAKYGERVTINAAFGGYGAGKKKARNMIEEQIGRLERAGYGMVYIGHTKLREVTDPLTDQSYQIVTGSLEVAYDSIFADRADFMPMFVTNVTVKDERKVDAERVIYFRSNNFVDAGSRLSGDYLPEVIPLDAKSYLQTLQSALEKAAGKTSAEATAIRKEEEKARVEQGKEFSDRARAESHGDDIPVEELKEKVLAFAKSLSEQDREIKKAELKHAGLPTKITDVNDEETLRKIYAVLKRES